MEKNKNDLKKDVLIKNKSGYKTKEKYVKDNFFNVYIDLLDYSIINGFEKKSFKEKLYLFLFDLNKTPACLSCGKELKFKKSFNEGYGLYCSLKCCNSSDEHKNKVKSTNINRFGGNSPISSPLIKSKIKETNLKKYGVENLFLDVDYIKKCVKSKHGVDHISKLPSTKEKIKKTNLNKYGVNCAFNINPNRSTNIFSLNQNFKLKYSHLDIIDIKNNNITIKCPNCGENYTIDRTVLFHRNKITENPCVLCNPIKKGTSIAENEISTFLDSLNVYYEKTNRTLLNGQELDYYLPEYKLAIEYDGLFWHCEKYCSPSYHKNKTEMCESIGIQLIHIFEDEWLYKKEIVQSRIKNLIGLTNKKIYARKCEIKILNSSVTKEFLNCNHIQGSLNSSIKLGLLYNNEIVSVMTFGPLRLPLGSSSSKNKYELLRFCNLLNVSVIGGANKLLKYFIKTYNPIEIISYADRRWSIGKLYKKMNFELIRATAPNYFYINKNTRMNRFNFRKNVLVEQGFDSNKTEREIMFERKIYRIYDSGSLLFKLTLDFVKKNP